MDLISLLFPQRFSPSDLRQEVQFSRIFVLHFLKYGAAALFCSHSCHISFSRWKEGKRCQPPSDQIRSDQGSRVLQTLRMPRTDSPTSTEGSASRESSVSRTTQRKMCATISLCRWCCQGWGQKKQQLEQKKATAFLKRWAGGRESQEVADSLRKEGKWTVELSCSLQKQPPPRVVLCWSTCIINTMLKGSLLFLSPPPKSLPSVISTLL